MRLAKKLASLFEDNDADNGAAESANIAEREGNVDRSVEEEGEEHGDDNGTYDPDVSSDSFDSDLECMQCEEIFKTREELQVGIALSSKKIASESYAFYQNWYDLMDQHFKAK